MNIAESVQVALLLTVLLAAMHALAPRLRALPFIPERYTTSFSGGFAVAFVFLHSLPGLIEQRDALGEILEETVELTPAVDLGVFIVALLGFNVIFFIDQWARRGTARGGNETAFFYVHLATFAVYNALITYTMPVRVEASPAFAIVFTLAMGLHFVINDRGMELHHPKLFARQGRVVLIGSLVAGWMLAWLTEPENVLAVVLLSSFLAGSVLMNVAKEEIPDDRDSSLGAFACGQLIAALMLLAVTMMEG